MATWFRIVHVSLLKKAVTFNRGGVHVDGELQVRGKRLENSETEIREFLSGFDSGVSCRPSRGQL